MHRVGNTGLVNQALHPLAQLRKARRVSRILQSLPVKGAELGIHSARTHRIPVAVAQQDEAGWDGQLGRDQLTHVRALAAGFLGIGDAQRGDVSGVGVALHEYSLLHGVQQA